MEVVGESHYQNALVRIGGGHNRYGHQIEAEAELVREPGNPFDTNAIVVLIHGDTVGYLPRDQAARVSAQMAEDGIERATCGAKIIGGWRTNQYDEGSFGVRLAIPCWGWIDFGLGKQAPGANKSVNTVAPLRPQAAENGPLKGQWVVIWGAPSDGAEARELANLGAHIMAGVGKSTTMVVQVDDFLTEEMQRSSTYKKAKARISEGGHLAIVKLSDLRKRFL
ncbi:MAG: HIRAN domain-containing protein [Rhodobacteraceae bacterium]|jgi:hypothetical protein|nr:HIRAN domain-containing protein [Paracoccaceae bacterium]